jgi:phage-related baseplate assembly protein
VYLYVHDGSGEASATLIAAVESAVELYRGCGIIVEVRAPVKVQPAVTVSLVIAENYDPDDVATDVEQGIIDWMNTFVLGQDFYLAELYQKIMDMNDKAILNAVVSAPTADIIMPSASVIRPDPLTVTVTGTSI